MISENADKLLSHIYPNELFIEIGHDTVGHRCINSIDKMNAIKQNASLLYGEISPSGVRKLLDKDHADIKNANYVFDLGMGIGKIVYQIFIEYSHLKEVVGVELSNSRFMVAEKVGLKLIKLSKIYVKEQHVEGKILQIRNNKTKTLLTIKCDNLFNEPQYTMADIVFFNTEIPDTEMQHLGNHYAHLKKGTKVISYNNFHFHKWNGIFPYFKQIDINKLEEDIFSTSWNKLGHKLFIWEKCDFNIEQYLKNTKLSGKKITFPNNYYYLEMESWYSFFGTHNEDDSTKNTNELLPTVTWWDYLES